MTRLLGWPGLALLLTPVGFAAWVSFSPDAFLTPPTGRWSVRWYEAFAEDRRWTGALVRSLWVAAAAAGVALGTGVPLAFAVARHRFRGRSVAAAGALLPGFVPPAVLGLGLLPLLYLGGLYGSPAGLVLAHGLLGLPAVFLVARAHLEQTPPDLEAAARGLGAGPWQVARRVTLPLVRPALLAGALAAFVTSLNEGMVSLFVAGEARPTLPVVVWNELRFAVSPKVAVASCASTAAALVAVWGVYRVFGR
jgi:ABC-type spermidine/putrescine transport system permease subunit II